MKKHFKYLFFLLLAIVCFILSQYFNTHSNTVESSLNQNKELQRIQSRITKKLNLSTDDAEKLKEIIENDNQITFNTLTYASNYPYYIYKSDQLIFWSSNTLVPPTSILNDTAKFNYIEIKKSKFIKQFTQVNKSNGETYKIYFLIPLYTKSFIQNQYLNSKVNKDFFENNYSVSILPLNKDGIIYSPEGIALFSLFLNPFESWNSINNQQITFTLFLLYLLFLNTFGILWIHHFLKQKEHLFGLLSVGFLIVFTRVNLLVFDFPFAYLPFDIFNAKFFASSIISTSIGDFLLNAIGVLIFSIFLFQYFFQLKIIRKIISLTHYSKICISILIIIASQGCFGIVYSIFQTINQHSQWVFDITSSLQLNSFQIISVVSFICISISFFCINHILIRLFIALNKNNLKQYFLIVIIGTIITPILFWEDRNFYWPILLINLLFIAFQFKLQMPRLLSRAKYSSYIYLIAVSMMCSLAGAIAINKIYNHKIIAEKLKFAYQTISESDILEEYLLKDIHNKITNDVFIKNNISSPISNKELIIQKIRRVFMANYLEKYDVKISVYSPTGESFFANEEYLSYNNAIKNFAKIKYATEHKNIFFINESASKDAPKFVIFNTIEKNHSKFGFILVQFLNKKIIPYSVFPELFIDKKYSSLNQPKTFSYAIFKDKEIEVNYGTVNYEKIFSKTYLEDVNLYEGSTFQQKQQFNNCSKL
ncbi:MAG: hypothetical protein EAZ07_00950 [Cytophagales bacterium]|nr:MAG: hypothetical protein EAZ07_00950 [Cytophagales bacterium]